MKGEDSSQHSSQIEYMAQSTAHKKYICANRSFSQLRSTELGLERAQVVKQKNVLTKE